MPHRLIAQDKIHYSINNINEETSTSGGQKCENSTRILNSPTIIWQRIEAFFWKIRRKNSKTFKEAGTTSASQQVFSKVHSSSIDLMNPMLLHQSAKESRFLADTVGNSFLILEEDMKDSTINFNAFLLLVLWYLFSFCTLFLNKYILSSLQGEPTLLGATQMTATTCFGFLQMYFPCGLYRQNDRSGKPRGFWRNMSLVGCMRFSTVVLGLFALKYISVSFTETVKSTAPLFTVAIAWFLLGERCGPRVVAALLPVMGGLALCSAYELSFNALGFAAAVAANLMDCLQNVFSKLLISGDQHKYTPAELQFYTSVASIFVQIPATYFVIDIARALQNLRSGRVNAALLADGICFHLQSITAYALMGYISPITHSVANTAKRAILIWLSVIIFGNQVTFLSALGTVFVLIGVFLYNKARQYELRLPRYDCRGGYSMKIGKSEQI